MNVVNGGAVAGTPEDAGLDDRHDGDGKQRMRIKFVSIGGWAKLHTAFLSGGSSRGKKIRFIVFGEWVPLASARSLYDVSVM